MINKVHQNYGGETYEFESLETPILRALERLHLVAGSTPRGDMSLYGPQRGDGHYATASDYTGRSGRSYHAAMLYSKRALYYTRDSCVRGDCNCDGVNYVVS